MVVEDGPSKYFYMSNIESKVVGDFAVDENVQSI